MTGEKQHFIYLLCCKDGSFYAGYTTDLQRRLAFHQRGKASRYTRSRIPVAMVYWKVFTNKGEALSAEIGLKRLTHRQKADLVLDFQAGRTEEDAQIKELDGQGY